MRDKPVVEDVIAQVALLLQVLNLIGHDVVESMVATLERLLVGETGLLQQVDDHVSSRKLSSRVEVDSDELSEPGRVVVPHGLGVPPSLKDGVGLDNLVLEGRLALLPLARRADGGKVGDDLLRVLSFSSARFSGDEDRLVYARVGHALVGTLGDRKDVGETLGPPLADIHL